MAVDERSRHQLHTKLEQILGPEEASTLMAHLPPVGWADVATKRDLDQWRVSTKSDLDQLRVATKRDLDQLTTMWRAELQATKSEILATLRHEFHSEIHSAVRALMVFMSAQTVAVAGIAFAAARLT